MKANGVAGACCLLAALWARAGDDIESQTIEDAYGAAASEEAAPADGVVRPIGIALVLVGIAGGMVVFLRRVGRRRALLGGTTVAVLETAFLSPKHSLALVRVRNRILLLGLGQEVTALATFERPEDVLAFDGAFSRELGDALAEEPAAGAAAAASVEPYRVQIGRLKDAVGKWRSRLKGEAQT